MKITATTTNTELAVVLASRGLHLGVELAPFGGFFQAVMTDRGGRMGTGKAPLIYDAIDQALRNYEERYGRVAS
jgi:hypothetical protein